MASANDMKAANATYASFISAVKVSTPVICLIAAFVVYLIAR
jgi:hypothetical protein